MLKLASFLFLIALSFSCQGERLSVLSQRVDRKYLASYVTGTPDWRKDLPDQGQCLIVSWALPAHLVEEGLLTLRLEVIFRSRELEVHTINLKNSHGYFSYPILNEKFAEKGGLLTYRAQILRGQTVVENWQHQMWFELLDAPPLS